MDETRRWYVKAYIVAAIVGVAIGLAYFGVTALLKSSLVAQQSIESLVSYRLTGRGPPSLYLVIAFGFGWVFGKLADRYFDTGLLCWSFIIVAALLSVGLGFGLSYVFVMPDGGSILVQLAMMCLIVMLIVAGWVALRE